MKCAFSGGTSLKNVVCNRGRHGKESFNGYKLYWDGNPDNKPTEKLSDEPVTEDTTLGELYSE